MRRSSLVLSGLLGLLTALPVMAVAYLGQQAAGLPFIPFDLFDWLARVLPGSVINFGIEAMVRLITGLGLGRISAVAKGMEQAQGILLVIAGGAAWAWSRLSCCAAPSGAGQPPAYWREAGLISFLSSSKFAWAY